MKSERTKLLIQVVSVLLFSAIVLYFLPPRGGGNMGEIFFRFIKGHLFLCMIGLFVSDVLIFLRRPRFIAAIVAFVVVFVGAIVGDILGAALGFLIYSLTGIHPLHLDVIGLFIVSITGMVLSYNYVAKRVRW